MSTTEPRKYTILRCLDCGAERVEDSRINCTHHSLAHGPVQEVELVELSVARELAEKVVAIAKESHAGEDGSWLDCPEPPCALAREAFDKYRDILEER